MKKLIVMLAIMTVCVGLNKEIFIKGFLVGIREREDWSILLFCEYEIHGAISTMLDAVRIMEHMQRAGVTRGCGELMSGVKLFTGSLISCLSVKEDNLKQTHKAYRESSRNPGELAYKMLNNKKPYIETINDCLNAAVSGNSYLIGKHIGTLVYKLLLA